MQLLSKFLLLCLTFYASSNIVLASNGNNEPDSPSTEQKSVKVENAVNSNTRYVFFKAVRKDCLDGDTEILSSIIQIDVSKFAQNKFSLLAEFEKEVQAKYPKNVIHINLNCIEGVYSDLREATNAKKVIIDRVKKVRSIVMN
ncbi:MULTISPECIES: hypothetical protein [Flammeovirga]|uniref:Uncharacterized protein n=1 Tax=Flammeovirga agarivorans TaxID=2726742 RepID=A0A7X8XX08_9BACT|nr:MULTISPECIES: hypothetical protein [Flammeovirga]NLR92749.1 hypothetical protein [Flammeovirga agarivorans]